MRKPHITNEDIDQILNDKLPVGHWELQLGIGYVYEKVTSPNIKFSAPYLKYGKGLWIALKYDLYSFICKTEEPSPREWVTDLVSGDIRNAVVGIAAAITSKYQISMGIAIPIVALVIKTGVLTYCQDEPKKPDDSSKKIFKNMLSWNDTEKKKKKKKSKKDKKKKSKKKH